MSLNFSSPFFGEEYQFSVPRDFQHLSFYLCENSSLTWDTTLGKVAIPHDDLKADPMREDLWYPIVPLDPDSEVQVSLCAFVSLKVHVSGGGDRRLCLYSSLYLLPSGSR